MDETRQPAAGAGGVPEIPGPLREHYRRKTILWRPRGAALKLDVPVGLFSGFQVDRGTRMLLRALRDRQGQWQTALDLGCGYGPVALYLAAAGIAQRVEGIDRDALAVAATAHNAEANGLAAAVHARGALAYDDLAGRRYDAIVSNIPAKAGRDVHRLMLLGACEHLSSGGEVWIVVVAPLAGEFDRILADPAVELLRRQADSQHVAYGYRFTARPQLPAGDPYVRRTGRFEWCGIGYALTAAQGIGEFDTRSWQTDVLAEALRRAEAASAAERLVVVEPGQGHVALLAAKMCRGLGELIVVSRDLLALRATRRNMSANGLPAGRMVHAVTFWDAEATEMHERPDVVLAALEDKEGMALQVAKVAGWCAARPGRRVIVGCGAAFASRLRRQLAGMDIRALDEAAAKGFRALTLHAE